jgi:hypothetical protein
MTLNNGDETNGKAVRITHLEQQLEAIAPKLAAMEQSINKLSTCLQVYIAGRESTCGVRAEMMEVITKQQTDLLARIVALDEGKVDKATVEWLWRILTIEGGLIMAIIGFIGALRAWGVW